MPKPTSPGKRKTLVIKRLLAAKFGVAAAMPDAPKRKRKRKPQLKRRRKMQPRPKLRRGTQPRPRR